VVLDHHDINSSFPHLCPPQTGEGTGGRSAWVALLGGLDVSAWGRGSTDCLIPTECTVPLGNPRGLCTPGNSGKGLRSLCMVRVRESKVQISPGAPQHLVIRVILKSGLGKPWGTHGGCPGGDKPKPLCGVPASPGPELPVGLRSRYGFP
jgi:hypothetical protein